MIRAVTSFLSGITVNFARTNDPLGPSLERSVLSLGWQLSIAAFPGSDFAV
jgi:hypothetical protein